MKKDCVYMMDIYRFLFTCLVGVMHFESAYFNSEHRIFEGGYLAVEFFFILSGYLLCKAVDKKKYEDANVYTKKRVLELIPYNLFMMICFLTWHIWQIFVKEDGIRQIFLSIISRILYSLYELVFLQMFLPSEMLNFVTWYVSVLIVVGYAYYHYLNKNRIGGVYLVTLLAYMFLNQTYGGLDLHIGATSVLKIAPGVIRGIADMGLGIIGYKISEQVKIKNVDLKRIIILLSMFMIIFIFPHTKLDFIFAGLVMILVVVEFADNSRHKRCGINTVHIRKLSLGMYFCHQFIILLWQYWNDKITYLIGNVMWKKVILYLTVVIAFAELMICIIDKIRMKVEK